MRSITVPERVLQQIAGGFTGTALYWPVEVDWPELRLTEEQQLANIGARLRGEPPPHDNHQIFTVILPRLSTEALREAIGLRGKRELQPVEYIIAALARHAKDCDCGGTCNHAAAAIERAWLDIDDEPDPPEYSGGGR